MSVSHGEAQSSSPRRASAAVAVAACIALAPLAVAALLVRGVRVLAGRASRD